MTHVLAGQRNRDCSTSGVAIAASLPNEAIRTFSDKTLLVGDAFCTTKAESFFAANLFQPAELHGPPSYFTSDWGAAKVSVRKLAGLEPTTVAPGHGKPLAGAEVPQALHTLADNFERIATPKDVLEGTQAGETSL